MYIWYYLNWGFNSTNVFETMFWQFGFQTRQMEHTYLGFSSSYRQAFFPLQYWAWILPVLNPDLYFQYKHVNVKTAVLRNTIINSRFDPHDYSFLSFYHTFQRHFLLLRYFNFHLIGSIDFPLHIAIINWIIYLIYVHN